MLRFLKKHWAATSAVLLAILSAAAVVAIGVAFPPAIAAIAEFSIFGATPFAFLSSMAAPAAIATVGGITAGVSLAASTLFNATVSVYNRMNNFFAQSVRNDDRAASLYAVNHPKPVDPDAPSFSKALSGLFSKCCAKKESEDSLLDHKHHRSPLDRSGKKVVREDEKRPEEEESKVYTV